MCAKKDGMFDNDVGQMARSLFGRSNATSMWQMCKRNGNKSGMRSAIGSMGGNTSAYNRAKKNKGW